MADPTASSRNGWRALHSGLTLKQAGITLLIVLLLGLLSSLFEVYTDWRALRAEVREQVRQTLALVQRSAVEAAYQLDDDMARQVVQGLFEYRAIRHAVLRDNFGRSMAESERDSMDRRDGLADRLFGDLVEHRLPLYHHDREGSQLFVGELEVTLSTTVIARRLLDRATLNASAGIVRALIISALVVFVFYLFITRPILRLHKAIARTDPVHPGEWPLPVGDGQRNDELGQLIRALDQLLQAFQTGLTQRDRAKAELTALTHELESRVTERTRELEQAMQALNAEKTETERAFRQLDQTHRELEHANQQVLESIRYARRIQTAMLPDKQALGDAVQDIHVCWEPLHLVGGDFFWLERFGDRSVIMVADCTGHGVPGAFITLMVASALDRILHEQRLLDSPAVMLQTLDNLVRSWLRQDHKDAESDTESDDGLDAAICLWDRNARTLTFAGVGLPLIYARDGETHEIKGTRGSLGYRNQPLAQRPQDTVVAVEPGMSFYLLTDGAHDHMGGQPRRLLGRRRLRKLIAADQSLPMAEQIRRIQHELERYRDNEPRRDDMTLIGFRPL